MKKRRNNRVGMNFETMEDRNLFAADIGMGLAMGSPSEPVQSAQAEVAEVASSGDSQQVYLKYKLDRCFIKSWSTSGDADDRPTEEVAFYYNKIAFGYAPTEDGVTFGGK